jgi:hypothetical protein
MYHNETPEYLIATLGVSRISSQTDPRIAMHKSKEANEYTRLLYFIRVLANESGPFFRTRYSVKHAVVEENAVAIHKR